MVHFFGSRRRTLLNKTNSGSRAGGNARRSAKPTKEQEDTDESMRTPTTKIKRSVLVHVDNVLSLAASQRRKIRRNNNSGITPTPTLMERRNSVTSVESYLSLSSSSDGASTPPRVLFGTKVLPLSSPLNETYSNGVAGANEDTTNRSIEGDGIEDRGDDREDDGDDDLVSRQIHHDDDDDDDDNSTEERFEEVLMHVDSQGWLTLKAESVFAADDNEPRNVKQEANVGMTRESGANNDVAAAPKNLPPVGSISPPRRQLSSDWFLESELESNSGSFDDSYTSINTPATILPPFGLAATNIHSDEEKKEEHERQRIRLEMLVTATEASQKVKVEVPDVFLAQIKSEKRLSLPSSLLGSAPITQPPSSVSSRLRPNQQSLVRFESENYGSRERLMPIPAQSSALPQPPVKRFKLCPEDEVHVVPCQCALSLVGMTPFHVLSPSSTDHLCANASADDAPSTLSYMYSYFAGTSGAEDLSPPGGQQQGPKLATLAEKPTRASMMRTASAKVVDHPINNLNATDDICHSSVRKLLEQNTRCSPLATSQKPRCSHTCSTKKTQPALFPTMATATSCVSLAGGNFPSMGYHEVTILRAGTPGTKSRRGVGDEEKEDGRCWDAISIRCCDHEEMDSLVNILRFLRIVPFSHNPRSKLLAQISKKRQREPAFWRVSRPAPDIATGTTTTTTTSTDARKLERADTPIIRNVVPVLAEEEDVVRGPKTWNRNGFCELCGFHFTLLTRRHHCRRCDRSCCGNCSSVMLVRGGGETRFCNRCSTEILEEQAAELRARFQKRSTAPIEIPGKIHHECRRLGVGVGGKLPHWRSYLTLNPTARPAVGRLTVEVLEAMALPAMGMNGKADPYVRATLTGYERDMKWALREWLPSNRFSLCSGYSSDTLSPVWRGSGRKGGELLTLPVITTASAVLRLEILHYDVLTNSKGKDRVLGVVEIPLSDLPNANLRRPPAGRKRKRLSYDGYCDRWYRLQCPSSSLSEDDPPKILLSQPIPSPHAEEISREDVQGPLHEVLKRLRRSKASMEEIGNRVQAYCRAPLDWLGAALDIDIPRRQPESICRQHRSRSAVHVRIKLNASEVGDLLCHAWFPPVRPHPPIPPYDPQVLLKNVLRIAKQIEPIHRVIKFIEDAIKWNHEPRVCVLFFLVVAVHLAVFQQLLLLLHIYSFVFLLQRLHLIKRKELQKAMSNPESIDGEGTEDVSMRSSMHGVGDDSSIVSIAATQLQQPLEPETSKSRVTASPSLVDLAPRNREVGREEALAAIPQTGSATDEGEQEEEEGARLNAAVSWIAKLIGDGKGLEDLQFKLGCIGKDLSNFHAIWNGTCRPKTEAALMAVAVSFGVHLRFHARWIWLLGMTVSYFGASPMAHLTARTVAGFFRGVAKIIRRRHLHEMEMLSVKGTSRRWESRV